MQKKFPNWFVRGVWLLIMGRYERKLRRAFDQTSAKIGQQVEKYSRQIETSEE